MKTPKVTKAQAQDAYVAAVVAKNGWEQVPASTYGGAFYARIALPAGSRPKTVLVHVRRIGGAS